MQGDYSLTGLGGVAAAAAGLADSQRYLPPIDPERLRALTERNNWRPARDSALWLALLVSTGVVAFMSLGTWALYLPLLHLEPSMATSLILGGTKTAIPPRSGPNGQRHFYYLAAFMLFREATLFRWDHFRHHSGTTIVPP
jgi:hypothetical protein